MRYRQVPRLIVFLLVLYLGNEFGTGNGGFCPLNDRNQLYRLQGCTKCQIEFSDVSAI